MGVEHLMRADKGSCPKEFQLPSDHPIIKNIDLLASLLDNCVLEIRTEMASENPSEDKLKLLQTKMDSIISTIDRYRFTRVNIEVLKHIKFPCLDCMDVAKVGKQ